MPFRLFTRNLQSSPYLPDPSFGEGPGAASPRRRRGLAFLTVFIVIILLGLLGSTTAPDRRALLRFRLATARSTAARHEIFARSFRESFTATPRPNDPPLPHVERFAPIDPGGFGAGWTFLLLHALGENDMHASWTIKSYFEEHAGFKGVRWLLPQAGNRGMPVARDTGQEGTAAWFRIRTFQDLHLGEDVEGYGQSARALAGLLKHEEEQGADMSKVVVGGFSQGSVMSMLLTLTLDKPPAACFVFSGFLPMPRMLTSLGPPSLSLPSTDLIWLHGLDDPYLTVSKARTGFDTLTSTVAFRSGRFETFPGVQHGFIDEEREIVLAWLKNIIAPPTA